MSKIERKLRALRSKGRIDDATWSLLESIGVSATPPGSIRPVVCVETGEVFESKLDAAKAMGGSAGSIGSITKAIDTGGTSFGRHWYYRDQGAPDRSALKPAPPRARAVVCWETGEVFDSMIEAARAKGGRKGDTIKVAAEHGTAAYGFHWYYQGDARPDESDLRINGHDRPVVCLETGERYPSAAEAARRCGCCSSSNILVAVKTGRCAGGRHWYREDQGRPDDSFFKKRGKSVAVRCVETGQVFGSMKDAASIAGVSAKTINQAVDSGYRAGGYHWERAEVSGRADDGRRLSPDELESIETLWERSFSVSGICDELGLGRREVIGAMEEMGLEPNVKKRRAIWNREKVEAMAREGRTDEEISAETGLSLSYVGTIRTRDAKVTRKAARRRIRCVETGEVFESIASAARAAEASASSIQASAEKGFACHGMHFEYVDREG